ncbi:hypothetical protein VNO78_22340 [Psophocarpus tetragonolobus]|uniref:Uncharacterized protein n=1 Tax=Psophocarpus tetragonolobus TaxID=3891 RepID=A0AAN9SD33_PSOTE
MLPRTTIVVARHYLLQITRNSFNGVGIALIPFHLALAMSSLKSFHLRNVFMYRRWSCTMCNPDLSGPNKPNCSKGGFIFPAHLDESGDLKNNCFLADNHNGVNHVQDFGLLDQTYYWSLSSSTLNGVPLLEF